jgi:IS5 family transposase
MSIVKLPNAYLSRDVYRGCIDEHHFLAQLATAFDWHALTEPLRDLGANDHGGRPRYPAVLMLKMLFIAFLFDHSDRDTEFAATNNLLVKYFLGLPIDERAPDHTSLCRFREDVLTTKGTAFFDTLFRRIISDAKAAGIEPGIVQALDATHVFAAVDTDQPQDPKTPRDPDAAWGCKGNETRITTEGTRVQIPKYFHGFKAHLIADTAHGFITGFHITPGNVADIDGGDDLVHTVMTAAERRGCRVLLADKGYGCPVWINLLEKYTGIMTAFSLPETMTTRGTHRRKWHDYIHDEGRRAFRRDRYVIERVNASLKQHHGLHRARYLGLAKLHLQTAMSAIAHNLKIIMRLTTGARLRST